MVKSAAANLWLSPSPHHNQREQPFGYGNNIIPFKPFSRTSLSFPTFHSSSTTILCSSSLSTATNHRITACNAEIRRLCELGDLNKAMDLLCKSRKSDIELSTYCSLLQLCAEVKSLKDGKKVHSIACSNGAEFDGVLGSKLVFMYVNCGDLLEGRRIFDKFSNENVFLRNFLINEYAKMGNFEESVFLYKRMLELGIEPDSYTFSCILKCFAALGCLTEGEKIHGLLLRLGFGYYNTVANSIISFYFKCGRTENARKVFDELLDRDVISWNSMISGYVANGFVSNGLHVFQQMLCLGVCVDVATMVSILAACVNIRSLILGRSIHGYAIKAKFDKEVSFGNTLLDMYSKCGDMNSAIQAFEGMDRRTVVSWTSMIGGYVREGLSDKAIVLFWEMQKEGIKPDFYTITSVLNACTSSGASSVSLQNGKEIHKYIRENCLESSLFVSNALMDMYAKCGSMDDAYFVFSKTRFKDIVSWNTMIGGYSKNSRPNEALNLFVEMQRFLKPDGVTITSLLPSCASLAALYRGREIHSHVLRNGFSSDRRVENALVDMYIKCGALILARLLFDAIADKDLVSWTVMIAGYGMHGFGNEAISTFEKMQSAGIEPDEVSFVSILYACSHSGLINEGWRFFKAMKNEFRIEPKLEHYACMVDLLSRAGKLHEAYEFITEMTINPDGTIWGSLLCGCRIHHDVELAEKVAEIVFELEPENTGYYVLLANIYAEAEKFEEAKKVRDRIGNRGLRKNPGVSWIEIKGKIRVFVVGDGSHPESKKIEFFLRKLRREMKEQGYLGKMRYGLFSDSKEMGKEVSVCGHSEKLAMALGILSLPRGETIRVSKNLRVCNDCHETAKFMSETVGREIVLRDLNRFHHFKDGKCSCRGYW